MNFFENDGDELFPKMFLMNFWWTFLKMFLIMFYWSFCEGTFDELLMKHFKHVADELLMNFLRKCFWWTFDGPEKSINELFMNFFSLLKSFWFHYLVPSLGRHRWFFSSNESFEAWENALGLGLRSLNREILRRKHFRGVHYRRRLNFLPFLPRKFDRPENILYPRFFHKIRIFANFKRFTNWTRGMLGFFQVGDNLDVLLWSKKKVLF